jgi:hypothetical protein
MTYTTNPTAIDTKAMTAINRKKTQLIAHIPHEGLAPIQATQNK